MIFDVITYIAGSVVNIFIIITIASFIAALFGFLWRIDDKEEDKQSKEAKKKFFVTITKGLNNGTINTLDDINNVYEGVTDKIFDSSSFHGIHLNKWLKEFLVKLISVDIKESNGNENRQEWHQKITGFIHKIEEESPYSELSDIEKSILTDISNYLENDDKENVNRKLSELAGIIQTRNDDLNKIRSTNKWAISLAVAGMVFTIIFGLLSIFT